jgi:hypothetical protein
MITRKRKRELTRAVAQTKLSKPIQKILIQIALEIEGAWSDRFDALLKVKETLEEELRAIRTLHG